jgi:alanyl-tRNA synthetase
MLTGSEIRRKFLDFFVQKGHREVHSSSLVPANDPTLLFTNAGMNQFKDVFLGLEKRDYNKATTSQKCVRAGGKHNDLENVGFTNRHHTFFEMLGNFSFGDYFKKDAIAYAWELITSPQWFGIPKEKLYVTVFNGEGGVPRDAEAHNLWVAQGIAKERIFEMGLKDNFWQMGDTGPCGPCSEIHYDMGPAASEHGHTDCAFTCDCGRYVEIWNLVFMQFDRDASGKLNPLPKPSIDTGMGLERLAAVLQGVISNYDTDLFTPLIERAKELTVGSVGDADRVKLVNAASMRIIADHSRAATFLISDGVLPSNEGRGYVLRKIIRRAIRHGRLAGQARPFLHGMVSAVCDLMGTAYPELIENADRVSRAILAEEKRFVHTLGIGEAKLEEDLSESIEGAADRRTGKPVDLSAPLQRLHDHSTEIFATLVSDPGAVPEVLIQEWTTLVQQIIDLCASALSVQSDHDRDNLLREIHPAFQHWAEIISGSGLWEQEEALNNIYDDIVALFSVAAIPWYPGEHAFKLFDTFGLPLDFIQEACRDRGVLFDRYGFQRSLQQQRLRARASWKGAAKQTAKPVYTGLAQRLSVNPDIHAPSGIPMVMPQSKFVGYTSTSAEATILAILRNGVESPELRPGEEGEVILDWTPFYAESGGQVGDRGWFYSDDHNTVVAEVQGCYSPIQGVRAHQVVPKQPIRVGDKVDAVVNTDIRLATMRNHTATHLLQAGLREVLGKHVKQAGSLVAPNHLRFDFSHFTAVEDEELQDIEDIINKEVLRNEKVEVIENVPIDVAVNEYHAMALFGEKYGDRVRVIKIGDFSTELCGGTHTLATGEIGLIKILKEGSVSSGVRRVEAITGETSVKHFRKDHELESVVASFAAPTLSQKTRKDGAPELDDVPASPAEALKLELDKKDAEIKRLVRELDQARMKSASSSVGSVNDKIKEVRGVKVLAHRVDNLERAQMRTLVDQLRDKLGSGVVVLGSTTNGSVSLIVGVTKDLTSRIQAGKVIGPVAEKVGGKGGGRPDLAEAGGKDPAALDAALGEAYGVVEGLLGN